MLMRLLLTMAVVTVAVLIAEAIFPGVRVRRPTTAIGVALVFGILNLFVAWLIRAVLAAALFPVALLTLGAIYFFLGLFVNSVLLWATDKLVDGFEIRSFWSLLGTAAVVSASGWLLNHLL
jgi:putative membrane protein